MPPRGPFPPETPSPCHMSAYNPLFLVFTVMSAAYQSVVTHNLPSIDWPATQRRRVEVSSNVDDIFVKQCEAMTIGSVVVTSSNLLEQHTERDNCIYRFFMNQVLAFFLTGFRLAGPKK